MSVPAKNVIHHHQTGQTWWFAGHRPYWRLFADVIVGLGLTLVVGAMALILALLGD